MKPSPAIRRTSCVRGNWKKWTHGEAEARERVDDDEQDGDRRGGAGDRPDLGARDVGERGPPASRRRPQDDHVVDGARETDAADHDMIILWASTRRGGAS